MKAQMGDRVAMREYGLDIWEHTSGRNDEIQEALSWLTKAANKGDLEAMFRLGCIKEMGSSGSMNPAPDAVHWFHQGAEAGDARCIQKLMECYQYGYLGVPPDATQYRYWKGKYESAYAKLNSGAKK